MAPGMGSKSWNRRCSFETWVHTSDEEHAVSIVMLAPFKFSEYEKRFEVMALAAAAAPWAPDRFSIPAALMHIQSSLSIPTKCPIFSDWRCNDLLSHPPSSKTM